jgi:hypothetical protein
MTLFPFPMTLMGHEKSRLDFLRPYQMTISWRSKCRTVKMAQAGS